MGQQPERPSLSHQDQDRLKPFHIVLQNWLSLGGRSEHDVKRICRIDNATVKAFVKGRANPTRQQLQRLCAANPMFKHSRPLTDKELLANDPRAREKAEAQAEAQAKTHAEAEPEKPTPTPTPPSTHGVPFYTAFRLIRTRLNLSIADIAELLEGVSVVQLARFEQGRTISYDTYRQLIDVLPSVDGAFTELTTHPNKPLLEPTELAARYTQLRAILDRLMIEYAGCVPAKVIVDQAQEVGIPPNVVYHAKKQWRILSHHATGMHQPWYWVSDAYADQHGLKPRGGLKEIKPKVKVVPPLPSPAKLELEPAKLEPAKLEPAKPTRRLVLTDHLRSVTWTPRLTRAQLRAPIVLPRWVPINSKPVRKVSDHCVRNFRERFLIDAGRRFAYQETCSLINNLVEEATKAEQFEVFRDSTGRVLRAVAVASIVRRQAHVFIVLPAANEGDFAEVILTVLPRDALPNTTAFESEYVFETVNQLTNAVEVEVPLAQTTFHNRIEIPADLVEKVLFSETPTPPTPTPPAPTPPAPTPPALTPTPRVTGRWVSTVLTNDLIEMGCALALAMIAFRERATRVPNATNQLAAVDLALTKVQDQLAEIQVQLDALQVRKATLLGQQVDLQTQKDQLLKVQDLMHDGVEDVLEDIKAIQAHMVSLAFSPKEI